MSTNTKTEALHEASRKLLAKGLNGFSLQELAESLKIKKASLFHHYPSKNALAIELYRFYQQAFIIWVEKTKHLPSEKQIIAYAKELTSWICDKNRVCPVGALSLEWNLVDEQLQLEMKKLHDLHKKWLGNQFKELPLKVPRKDAVISTIALIQGSVQLARITGKPDLVIQNLKTHLKSLKV
jgi:TetR/AcrR family transcriptional repressor of nem operon